jgi:valyl-tRNA synthetase
MSEDIAVKKCVSSILVHILKSVLQFMSPVMPFITEEIWQTLHKDKNESIIADSLLIAIKEADASSIEKMKVLQDIIIKIRTLRSEMNVSPAVQIEALFNILDDDKEKIVKGNESYIKQLAKIKEIKFGKKIQRPANSALAVAGGFEIFLPLEGLIDIEKEKARLAKEISLAMQEAERTNTKLQNENFVTRAPASEIEKIKIRLSEARIKIEKINESLKFLN